MHVLRVRKRTLLICLLFCFLLAACERPAVTAETGKIIEWSTLCVYGDPDEERTKVSTQTVNGEAVLILPSTVSPNAVTLYMAIPDSTAVLAKGSAGSARLTNGGTLDLTALCTAEDYTITLQAVSDQDSELYTLKFLFSDHIGTMYLVSDSPVTKGREWVESSLNKSNKATGSMVLLDADGMEVYNGALTQIKGRGNSTWNGAKKPYQIKLDSKTDLLQTGNSDNMSKTWVLLANYYDPALLRNTMALNLGNALGMRSAIESTYVDLYYDGEYRGCYLLSEKAEVSSGRVDITDMEKQNEQANPNIGDFGDLPVAAGTTENGATYTYCVGMESPEDITGGYLLEMDYAERAVEEACYFFTTQGKYIVVKSPEYASQEEMEYIASLYQEYEDAIYSNGVNPSTGKAYKEYVDLLSVVQYTLINEFTRNMDGFQSSTYLYKDAGTDVMTMGPLWDYDLSMGLNTADHSFSVSPEGMQATGFCAELYKLTDFRKLLKNVYATNVYPLVTSVLQGDIDAVSENGALHSLEHYVNLIDASASCDAVLWGQEGRRSAAVTDLRGFIRQRAEYLKEKFESWPDVYDPVSDFEDISPESWYYEEVCRAARYGLMRGVSVTSFAPEGNAERSHVVQTIYNMAGAKAEPYEQLFADVSQTDWFSECVTWAAGEGIVQGYPDGTFQPSESVSREDLMVLLYRYHGSPEVADGYLSAFTDADQISAYAWDAMQWAVREGLIQGYLDSTVKPKNTAIRAELAAVLVRYYERYELVTE